MAAGWWKYAGHQWPVDHVELLEGKLRITISGLAMRDVPAGITSGELYGSDGALVFRHPAMEHTDIHAGEFGSLVLNFFLPQQGVGEDVDPEEIGVALDNMLASEANRDPSVTDLLKHARNQWVNWRSIALPVGGIAAGTMTAVFGAPGWAIVSVSSVGLIAMLVCNYLDREWWTKR